jgi:N-methylhydantoinase A
MRRVIVPRAPGHFCAFGMLFSDLRYDLVRTWFTRLSDVSFDAIDGVYAALTGEGKKSLAASGVEPGRVAVARSADMRYVGQEHPVTVALPSEVFRGRSREALKRRFDEEHLQRYGTCAPEEPAEIVSLRVAVTGAMKKPPLERIARGGGAPPDSARRGKRGAYFAELGMTVPTPTYARDALRAGNRIDGPALVEEHASMTVVPPGDRLRVDGFGNLDIEIARRRA